MGELSELDALNKELAEKGGSLIGVNTFTLDGDEAAISEAKDVPVSYTHLSAALKNSCKTPESISGTAKRRILPSSGPLHMSIS